MKSRFLLLSLTLLTILSSFAQISFDNEGQTNNDVDSTSFDYNWTVYLTNNTDDASDSSFYWVVKELDKTPSWSLTICAGDECVSDPAIDTLYCFNLVKGDKETFKLGFSMFSTAGYGNVTVLVVSKKDGSVRDSASLSIATTVGVDYLNVKTFNAYPNPTKDFITVDFIKGGSHEIKVYDILGNALISKDVISGGKLDLTSLPKGVYFLRREGSSSYSKVIQKQ
jgi:hypothetical protein